jgi:hypothetical protein
MRFNTASAVISVCPKGDMKINAYIIWRQFGFYLSKSLNGRGQNNLKKT